jgi:peroxiredoxin Q/BCP
VDAPTAVQCGTVTTDSASLQGRSVAKPPEVGSPAPDFTLPAVTPPGRRDCSLSAERGHPVVLAFYPGDDTRTCARQLCSYQDDLGLLTETGAVVWGISTQDLDSHARFAAKRGLTFPLLADTDKAVVAAYGVNGPLGTRRSVFVVDADGVVRWRHVAAVGLTYRDAGEIAGVLAGLTRAGDAVGG